MNFGDFIEEARARAIDKASAVTDSRAQMIASLLIKDLIVRTGGWWLYDEYTFTATASTGSYAMPSRYLKSLLLFNTTNNKPITQTNYRSERADIDRSDTGTPESYWLTYRREVQNQPSSASKLSVTSTSTSDTAANGHYLRVRGLDSSSLEIRETLSMNGTSAVESANTYSEVYTLEKATSTALSSDDDNRYFSNGQYTVTSNSAAVTIVKLGAEERSRKHQWFRLGAIPDAADSYRLHFLRRPAQVSNNYDSLDMPDFLDNAALFYLEWYVKKYLLDQRDEATFKMYLEQVAVASDFLRKMEDEIIGHGIIDPTRSASLYQPPAGYISRRAS